MAPPIIDTVPGAGMDLGLLLASVIHDTKNGLGQMALLLDRADDLGVREALRHTCRKLSDRMTQILLLYRADMGRLGLHIEPCSPAEIVEDMAREASSLIGSRISVRGDIEGAPAYWFFDRYLVELALLNGVYNAIPQALASIRIAAQEHEDGMMFVVEDDGPGYPRETLAHDYVSLPPHKGGGGIGLYFAHHVAMAHYSSAKEQGGRLILSNDSALGGAKFGLVIP